MILFVCETQFIQQSIFKICILNDDLNKISILNDYGIFIIFRKKEYK